MGDVCDWQDRIKSVTRDMSNVELTPEPKHLNAQHDTPRRADSLFYLSGFERIPPDTTPKKFPLDHFPLRSSCRDIINLSHTGYLRPKPDLICNFKCLQTNVPCKGINCLLFGKPRRHSKK